MRATPPAFGSVTGAKSHSSDAVAPAAGSRASETAGWIVNTAPGTTETGRSAVTVTDPVKSIPAGTLRHCNWAASVAGTVGAAAPPQVAVASPATARPPARSATARR